MVTNHFIDDYFLSFQVDEELVSSTRDCLSIFCKASVAKISYHKTNYYYFIGIDEPPNWIPPYLTFIHPSVIEGILAFSLVWGFLQ